MSLVCISKGFKVKLAHRTWIAELNQPELRKTFLTDNGYYFDKAKFRFMQVLIYRDAQSLASPGIINM